MIAKNFDKKTLNISVWIIKQLLGNVPILNQRFPGDFRGHKMGTLPG